MESPARVSPSPLCGDGQVSTAGCSESLRGTGEGSGLLSALPVKAIKGAKHAAPGPYLGFGLQTVRLCYHLLTAPKDSAVSIEHDDDVSVHYADGSILLEQAKSALNSEPLANKAVDLWKTFGNWVNWDPNPKSRSAGVHYCLYVTPRRSGELALRMSGATTDESATDVLKAIAGLRTKVLKAPAWQQHLRIFLTASLETQVYIVSRFSVQNGDDDPLQPIRERLMPFVSPDLLDEVCKQIIGHAKTESDQLLRKRLPGTIRVAAFHQYVQDFLRKLNSPALFSLAAKPTSEDVEKRLREAPLFVLQLDLINATPRQRMESVSDYLQSVADKALWAEAGKIFPETLGRWDQDLLGLHESVRTEVEIERSHLSVESAGMLVYVKCRQMQASLDTYVVTAGFIHGSLHELADKRRLGWHRDYLTLT